MTDLTDITPAERQRVEALRTDFMAKLRATPEKHQRALINATAFNMLGTADAYTQRIAQTLAEQFDAQDRVVEVRQQIEEIDRLDLTAHRPGDPDFRGRMLAKRADLEQAELHEAARYVGLAERDHSTAMHEAIGDFREADAQAAKTRAKLEAIERIRAEREAADVEAHAAKIVDAERKLAQSDLRGTIVAPDGDVNGA